MLNYSEKLAKIKVKKKAKSFRYTNRRSYCLRLTISCTEIKNNLYSDRLRRILNWCRLFKFKT